MNSSADILKRLADTIDSRLAQHGGDPNSSYTAKLLQQGPNKFLKKIGEESAELIMAAKDEDKSQIIYETADLWFHSMVALSYYGLRPEDILNELARREGISGLTEKANRNE